MNKVDMYRSIVGIRYGQSVFFFSSRRGHTRYWSDWSSDVCSSDLRGTFREDLFYRLNVVHVDIPPLRTRSSDIPPLARHLLARIAEQPGMRHLSITDDALAVLMAYGWPGNVRQLQNALFRAAVLCEGNALTAADFPHIAQESTYSKRADDYHAKA